MTPSSRRSLSPRRPRFVPGGPLALLVAVLVAALAIPASLTLARQEPPAVTGVPDPTVRVVHASPDAPAVDILVDGQPVAQNLAFGSATEYAPLTPGDHQVQVVPTGGGQPVLDQAVTLEGDNAYILAAVGQLANIQLQANQVDVSELAPGQARVRVVHAVPDGPAVDVAIAGSQEPLIQGVEFPNASDYQTTEAGTYDLEVRNAETGETLLTAPGVAVESGLVYDVYALGTAADPASLRLLPLTTPVALPCGQTLGIGEPTDSCLRVVHASPDAGPVDVYVGETPLVQGLQYGSASAFAPAANGQQQLRVVPAGAPVDQAVVDTTLDLTSGDAFQLNVAGPANELQSWVAGVDLRPLPANQARARVVHASPDTGAVNVAVAGGPTPFEQIEYGSQSGYVVFDAGSYAFQLRLADGDTLLLESPPVELQPGMVYDLVALGQSEAGTLQLVVFNAQAAVLAGGQATPIAATPAAAGQAAPATAATPVVAVGASPVVETPGAATPAVTPTS